MTAACSEISRDLGEPLAGTASVAAGFLLLEHGGAWAPKALASTSLPDGLGSAIETACAAAALKPLLIRRPSRERAVAEPALVLSVPDGDGLAVTRRLARAEQVAELDLTAVARAARAGEVCPGWEVSAPLLAVCTHGRRDVCCARLGRPLATALAGLTPDRVWECSHLGGHRLAAGVLVLPTGLVYGRVEPALAPALLAAVSARRVLPDLLRGRSHLPTPLQVSEVALRRAARAPGERDVSLVASDAADLTGAPGHRTTSVWRVADASWRVVVDSTPGGTPRPVSCGAEPEPAPEVHTVVEVADASGPGRGARGWDDRYRAEGGPAEPHPAVVETVVGHAAGHALDLACGTGRHSLWLAEQGWAVTALDFSRVAITRLQQDATGRGLRVDAHVGDARAWTPPEEGGYDLVLMSFAHLPAVVARAARWLAPGGRLLVVGHSARTPEGTGPSDPRLLMDRVDLAARVTGARLRVLRAAEVERQTADGATTDMVLLAVRP